MEILTKESFIEKVFDFEKESEWKFKGEKPAILDFWAPWCGPCMRMKPVIEQLKEEYKGKIIIKEINVDNESELAIKYEVKGIPNLVLTDEGEEIARLVGGKPKSEVQKMINDNLKDTKVENYLGEKQ